MAEWRRIIGSVVSAAVRLLWDFRATLLIVFVVLGLCATAQVALDAGVLQLGQVSASRANPIGVVTSVFAHYDWSHLEANALGLLFFGGALVFTNIPMPSAERLRRSKWFAMSALPLAVVVNILYVALAPGSTSGASGLVYAAFGIGFAFFLNNARDEAALFVQYFRAARTDAGSVRPLRRAFWWLGMDVAFVAIFLYLIEFDLPALFGVGYSGINAFAHLMGFLLGFVFTIVRSYLPRLRSLGAA